MTGCLGYVSTAGFESICEAMYLGKPVMMVPVENQYEQACNALDAVKAGAGITNNKFIFDSFLDYLSTHSNYQESGIQLGFTAQNYYTRAIDKPHPTKKEIHLFNPASPFHYSIL